jgi:hypothetical protein
MGLGLSFASRWQSAARMLALVAAIMVALGVHPTHAAAGQDHANPGTSHHDAMSHSHFSAGCLQAELDAPQAPGNGGGHLNHADCTQVFDPLLRSPLTGTPIAILISLAKPGDLSFRQRATSFDPPPPRRG